MLPIVLEPTRVPVILAGAGEAVVRRFETLVAGGVRPRVFVPEPAPDLVARFGRALVSGLPGRDDLADARILFVAGLDAGETRVLAALARTLGVLVNVEDDLVNCDFHMPATVRRGGLVLGISTGGLAPGLAPLIRRRLEARLGPEWAARVDELAVRRRDWRDAGDDSATIGRRISEHVESRGWLEDL